MKRLIAIFLSLVLTVSAFPCSAEETRLRRDASPQMIVAAVEDKALKIADAYGEKFTMLFPFTVQGYDGFADFRERLGSVMHPLMTAIFAADTVGRDQITVRTSYAMRSQEGRALDYYYCVELSVHSSAELAKRMAELVDSVAGLPAAAQVDALQNYLYENVVYDEDCIDASGSYLALMDGRAVCMGYSRAMMELCRRLNIPCIALISQTHMWNAVYVEGAWQMLDVTWNIPRCESIAGEEHVFDVGVYRRVQYYFQNHVLNLGFARADAFTDLTASWYNTAVAYALGQELFYGVSQNKFAPDLAMNRAMFVTVLGRLAGAQGQSSGFVDVPRGQYYAPYVGWAQTKGIVSGVGGNRFAPEQSITRQELCCMLCRFAVAEGFVLPEGAAELFADDGQISRWAREYVYVCRAAEWIRGKGNNRFDPLTSTTRAEVAVILYGFCKKLYFS